MSTLLEISYQPIGQLNVEDDSTEVKLELSLTTIGPKGDKVIRVILEMLALKV